MKEYIIKIIKSNTNFLNVFASIYSFPSKLFVSGSLKNKIVYKGVFLKNTKIRIDGNNNSVIINSKNRLTNCVLHISGNNCSIEIDDHCILKNLELWVEDDGSKIKIGNRTTIEGGHIAATEGKEINIGNDCMFSSGIQIRNGDSHSIFDLLNNERINNAIQVKIGSHVWLGNDVKVLKGSIIDDNSIIGTGSIVTGHLSSNSIYVGAPPKKVRKNIYWERQR